RGQGEDYHCVCGECSRIGGTTVASRDQRDVSDMGYDGYDSGFTAFFAIYIVTILIVSVVSYVVGSFLMMKVFDKAGITDRWRAWVPVYNTMIFFKLGDLSPWLVLYATAGALLLSWIGIGLIFAVALQVFAILAAWRIGL